MHGSFYSVARLHDLSSQLETDLKHSISDMLLLIIFVSTSVQFVISTELDNTTSFYGFDARLDLCDFSSHNSFISGLEDILREEVTRALLFSFEKSHFNSSDDFIANLNFTEYTTLQILHGLINGDEAYAKMAAKLFYQVDPGAVPSLNEWLKNNFEMEKPNLYEALTNYINWKMDQDHKSKHLTQLIVLIAQQYQLDDLIIYMDDRETETWLAKHGHTIVRPTAKSPREPPLHGAAERGDLPGVRDLIGRGEKVNCTGRDGSTPLHKASFWGHLDVVRELLNRGAPLDCRDRSGETPLCWAVNGRKLPVIEELLGKGACVNCADYQGRTPLHSAAWWGNLPIAKELIEFGADVNSRDSEGNTPLHSAEQMFSIGVAKLLRSLGGIL